MGFVYERVPHITLKSIANNAEIDVIWDACSRRRGGARRAQRRARGHAAPFKVETGGRAGAKIDFRAQARSHSPPASPPPLAAYGMGNPARSAGRLAGACKSALAGSGTPASPGRARSTPRSPPRPSSNTSTTSPMPTARASASPAPSRSKACRRTASSPSTRTTS